MKNVSEYCFFLGIAFFAIFILLKGEYLLILGIALFFSYLFLYLNNGIKMVLMVMLLTAFAIVLTEYLDEDIKKVVIAVGGMLVIVRLISKYKKGENIW